MKKQLFALVAATAFVTGACAQVTVTAPWIRATVPQQKSTGAFMELKADRDTRLVEVRSPVAGSAEIHQMEMKGHMMSMRPVDGVDLPAGTPVRLASGGYHIMLLDLKRQLKAGDSVPLTLLLQSKGKKSESVTIQVPVRPLAYVPPTGPAP